jgi:hypothetical protein
MSGKNLTLSVSMALDSRFDYSQVAGTSKFVRIRQRHLLT